jgi:2-polyprenyl-3-methyl-5-hydroxy-6-metoxy-1,4-benzoquinol methylase
MEQNAYYIEYLKRTARFPQSIYHAAKHSMVRRVITALPRNSRILDAGCGIGHISEGYCGEYEIYGLDEQPEAIAYCRQHYHGTYTTGSLYATPFADDFFDAVLFLDAIEHLQQPIPALRELARILKPGGVILICTMNYASPLWFILEHTWHRFFGGTCKPYSKDVHPTPYTGKLLRQHCEGLFKEICIQKRIMGMELFYVGKK